MSELAVKGKKQTTTLVIFIVVITLLGMIAGALNGSSGIVDIIKGILTLLCVWFLYKGKSWARTVLIVWLSISGGISLLGGIVGMLLSPLLGVILIVSAIISLGIAIFLGVNKAIKEYFIYCKN